MHELPGSIANLFARASMQLSSVVIIVMWKHASIDHIAAMRSLVVVASLLALRIAWRRTVCFQWFAQQRQTAIIVEIHDSLNENEYIAFDSVSRCMYHRMLGGSIATYIYI